MTTRSWMLQLVSLLFLCHASPSRAQVDYGEDRPWDQRAESGPDAKVPGWFYNLGITGLRARLVADEPKALLIKYVFPKSPADGQVKVGDLVVGAGGRMFQENHRNGYGEKVFGADGPISELAQVLEECQSADRKGKLPLTLRRGKQIVEVSLDVGTKYGAFAPTFPHKCQKSDRILAELLQYLVDHQQKDGSFGDPVHNTFAPLALLASGEAKYLPAVKRNVKYHCGVTKAKDLSLINWSYMSAAIVLSEYHLATGDKTVLPDLQKVHDLLAKSQYLRMSQIDPRAKKSHPDSFPKGPRDSYGGWGHNPGFEGYGPIAMLTGQGALAYSLMHRCGITIDRKNHDAAYDFLKRGTGKNGYVWYGDQTGGGPKNWADMGRTGAAGIANFLSPYDDPVYRERALSHARVIGKHPQSFPDTHGSPPMGMAYAALAASVDADGFRRLMDANRWWFTMAHCTDGSFYYQPNRDNSNYGSDSRTIASAVTAFILTIPKRGLVMTGKEGKAVPKPADKPGAPAKPLKVFILAGQSNMQGHASVSTFDSLADDPKTAPLLKEMRGPDGKPRVCEKVWISSVGCLGDAYSDLTEAKGKLTAGFGAPENKIGPEFTFGLTMEKRLNEPVLIIKTSWGGRSLHTDFRPPSAGPYVWSEYESAQHKERGDDLNKVKAEKVKATGVYYREMIAHVRKVLKEIKRVVPDYDEKQGYELAGFVWFQGFNDLVSDWTYDKQMKPGGYDLYADLLGHFIRDVRKDLSAPKMPFVIGVMGIDGMKGNKNGPMMHFREAQRKPSTLDEFKGNVFAVETAPFWDDDLEKLQERMENCWPKVDAKVEEQKKKKKPQADSWENKMKLMAENFTPEEWKRLMGASNGGYHYLGAAKILAPIGQAFAEALVGKHPTRDGTLHLLSFGAGAPIKGTPADDLYGRDAGFIVEAVKRSPSAWKRVETAFVSGLECTPERLLKEVDRLVQDAKPGDLVFIHASTHGTTKRGLLQLDSEKGKIIDADVLSARLDKLPCPAIVTIDACEAGGAKRSALPKKSAWLLGCEEKQSTSGQTNNKKVPHGFLVLAMCEALRGDADADGDGLVMIGELFKWVPSRAKDLAHGECEQDAVTVLPDDLAKLPLTVALPGKQEPLWTPKKKPPERKR